MRRRCTECRTMFVAAASASATQRVCSIECRGVRDRKQARERRRRDVDEARADERERQRGSRDRRSATSGCHVGPSEDKCPLSRAEVGQFVDQALALSRATLVRDFRGVLGRYAAKFGEGTLLVTQAPRAASPTSDEGFRRNRGGAVTHDPGPGTPSGA
jgi:Ni/Co efflux regulator RcnB